METLGRQFDLPVEEERPGLGNCQCEDRIEQVCREKKMAVSLLSHTEDNSFSFGGFLVRVAIPEAFGFP